MKSPPSIKKFLFKKVLRKEKKQVMNVKLLRKKWDESDMTLENLADYLECDKSTASRLLNGKTNITVNQAIKIAELLSLTRDEVLDIFFEKLKVYSIKGFCL